MKIALVKQLNNSFKIAYDSDYEKCKRLKVGEIYFFEVKKQRNILFHRKFFALINLVFENQEVYSNADDLRYDLTIEAGFFTRRTNLEGDQVKKPKSISFSSMDETEFEQLYDAFLNVVVKYFKFDKRAIEENIMEFY